MGVKRPLEEGEFPELSFKQLDDNIKLSFATEDFPRVYTPGEAKNNFCEFHFDGMLKNDNTDGMPMADKELEASAPSLSLITSSSSEEDAGNKHTAFFYDFPGYIDSSVPFRPPVQFQDPYASLLNCSPRKLVPLGPDYQAELPHWDPSSGGKEFSHSKNLDSDQEQKLMGTCVFPMPELNDSSIDGGTVGQGRTDCSCLDVGSTRCVRQHVKEAREKLRETIGDEIFMKLGFYEMGEEVASNWTADDEQVFHEVIFSNPVSHGRDFWKLLSAVFPNRTKMELVSYYFNVFMLWRRAVQNRSHLLQVDSDDDEDPRIAHGDYCQNRYLLVDQDTDGEYDMKHIHEDFCLVGGEDEDSTVETFGDQDLDAGWMDDYGSGPENSCGHESRENNHGTCSDVEDREQDGVEMDGGSGRIIGQESKKLHHDHDSRFGA